MGKAKAKSKAKLKAKGRSKGRKLHTIGISEVIQCARDGNVKLQIRGRALKLKGFGFPNKSYYGEVPTVGSPPEVDPVAIDSSTGAHVAADGETDCLEQGRWCIEINRADDDYVSEFQGPDPTDPDEEITFIRIDMLLWHYYSNPNDMHVVVEQCVFVAPKDEGDPDECEDCGCG